MNLLPVFYFPPISYFYYFLNSQDIVLEQYENFKKQTYRNRCAIQGANGKLFLIIPIKHKEQSRLYKDTKISYESNWQKIHFKSIKSAYQSSPYFEYYEDKLLQIFKKRHDFLYDLNIEILEWCINLLNIKKKYRFTEEFSTDFKEIDYRLMFNPKVDSDFYNEKYIQVFSDRFSFMNDLSILDLIFNIGPKSIQYISQE